MIVRSYFLLLALFCFLCSWVDAVVASSIVWWNKTNTLFAGSLPMLNVPLNEEVHFYCPKVGSKEKYKIHWVKEDAFAACRTGDGSALAFTCTKHLGEPHRIRFSPYSAIPFVPDFKSGESYYLISTSTGDAEGLDNRIGGACLSSRLKLHIRVLSPRPKVTTPITGATTISRPRAKIPRDVKDQVEHQPQTTSGAVCYHNSSSKILLIISLSFIFWLIVQTSAASSFFSCHILDCRKYSSLLRKRT